MGAVEKDAGFALAPPSETVAKLYSMSDTDLKSHLEVVFRTQDLLSFTPNMVYLHLAETLNYPVEAITGQLEFKNRVKMLARELAHALTATPDEKNEAYPTPSASNPNEITALVRYETTNCSDTSIIEGPRLPQQKRKRIQQRSPSTEADDRSCFETRSTPDLKPVKNSKRTKSHKAESSRSKVVKAPTLKKGKGPLEQTVQRLRKCVSDLMIGPSIYRGLSQSDTPGYCETLKKRLIEKCQQLGILPRGESRLPSATEIQAYKKQKERQRELDGLAVDNIITYQRTRRRTERYTRGSSSLESESSTPESLSEATKPIATNPSEKNHTNVSLDDSPQSEFATESDMESSTSHSDRITKESDVGSAASDDDA